jgi:hypothetical protein
MTRMWWYFARSSGAVAWALLAASVVWGLLLSTRVFDRRPTPKWLTDLHRFLGGLAVTFTGLHIATLVADSYVHFGAADVLVPFASHWRPVAVAWGVVALWLLAAVEITSLLMRHLPRRFWRAVHASSFVAFLAATVHGFTAGTDTKQLAFVVAGTIGVTAVALLALVRMSGGPRRPARRPAVPARAVTATGSAPG